jgi:hypothetical protein
MPSTHVERAVDKLIQEGIDLLQAGDVVAARELFSQAVVLDPRNEKAWIWRSGAVETDAERKSCLLHVLAINPNNKVAQHALDRLSQPAPQTRRVKRLSIQPPAAAAEQPSSPNQAPAGSQESASIAAAKKTYSKEMLYWPEAQTKKRPIWLALVLVVAVAIAIAIFIFFQSYSFASVLTLPTIHSWPDLFLQR